MSLSSTVAELKARLLREKSINMSELRLICCGKQWDDGKFPTSRYETWCWLTIDKTLLSYDLKEVSLCSSQFWDWGLRMSRTVQFNLLPGSVEVNEKLWLGCGQEFRDSRQITSYEFDTFTVHLLCFPDLCDHSERWSGFRARRTHWIFYYREARGMAYHRVCKHNATLAHKGNIRLS